MAYYLDTSAFLPLVLAEGHSEAMRDWTRRVDPDFVSTDLLRTAALRVARRQAPDSLAEVRSRLDSVTLRQLSTDVCRQAADLDPAILRALDALHLAGALSLGDALEGLLTYDARLAEAARLHGVAVIAPT